MKIVGIAGVFRPHAYVRRLLKAIALELPEPKDVELWDGLERIPPIRGGPLPAEAAELCRVLSAADAVLIAAPEHSLLPPQLTHALSWASSPMAGGALVGKPAAVVTSCVSPHEAMWTQAELHRLLRAGGAIVHGADLPVRPGARQFDILGRLADPVARARLRPALRAVCATARDALETKAAYRGANLTSLTSATTDPEATTKRRTLLIP
ncbi:NAD(P)H-dependent oxidoreductase [Nonomuraea africana]|uniref:Chromate reductase n=1 Tax=Nonomuraea africana TaxID=46171 RepID=A0ABR9KB92_9ACTN|nr:NAD(P)H-dependent oxidoreductase [Nonomuraea africana]MBE1559277.1 chromate reductase [Nonomuraea africana]